MDATNTSTTQDCQVVNVASHPLASLSLTARCPAKVAPSVRARPVPLPPSAPVHASSAPKPASRTAVGSGHARCDRARPKPGIGLVSALVGAPIALFKLATGIRQAVTSSQRSNVGPSTMKQRIFPSMLPCKVDSGHSERPHGVPSRHVAIMWFRNDVRLHDNAALVAANKASTSLLPVYCFDPREYGKGAASCHKAGPQRAQFVLESVQDLRARLQQRGSDLAVRLGWPEAVLPDLARLAGAGVVYCHGGVTREEVQVEASLRRALEQQGVQLQVLPGGTLYHSADLPLPLASMPSCYSQFRALVARTPVRGVEELGEKGVNRLPLGRIDLGNLPSLQQLGFKGEAIQRLQQVAGPGGPGSEQRGGETQALKQLQVLLTELKSTARSETRANASSSSSSSSSSRVLSCHNQQRHTESTFACCISPWLAMGCLSPRQIYHDLHRQLGKAACSAASPAAPKDPLASQPDCRASEGLPQAASWLVFELLWRDFFQFVTQKYQQGKPETIRGQAEPSPT